MEPGGLPVHACHQAWQVETSPRVSLSVLGTDSNCSLQQTPDEAILSVQGDLEWDY